MGGLEGPPSPLCSERPWRSSTFDFNNTRCLGKRQRCGRCPAAEHVV